MLKVLSIDNNNKSVNFNFYFPIPDGNNSVPTTPLTWAEAVTLSGKYETEIINSVVYIKQQRSFQFSTRNLTNAQRVTELTNHHTELLNAATAILQRELRFTGYTIT